MIFLTILLMFSYIENLHFFSLKENLRKIKDFFSNFIKQIFYEKKLNEFLSVSIGLLKMVIWSLFKVLLPGK